eukprot:8038984-Pyramimonas_sp.AAC.1
MQRPMGGVAGDGHTGLVCGRKRDTPAPIRSGIGNNQQLERGDEKVKRTRLETTRAAHRRRAQNAFRSNFE